ncbi:MAG: hypothetical protein QM743_14075 [Chitinophagaceae bacterium]
MKKTLVYLVVLAILGCGVYWFFFQNSDNLYSSKDADFGYKDTASVGRIFLAETNGISVLLERNPDNSWTLNKKYPAMPIQIINILTCLNRQTALSPVPEKDRDRVIKLLAGMGVKVELYDRSGKKLRCFYVAGQGPNYHGSYMLMEGSQEPYLVEIRGFEGYLTPRYTTDEAEWRSRSVFQVADYEIRSFSVTYPGDPLNSFTIDNSGSKATVQIDPELGKTVTQLNQGRTNIFLTLFKNVNAEGHLNGAENLDSIISHSTLRARLTLTLKSGAKKDLDVYWIEKDDRYADLTSQTSTDPNNRPTDIERLYAVDLIQKDTLLLQRLSFEKFFRKAYEFYQTGNAAEQPATQPGMPLNNKKAPVQYAK